ncbi:MAG: response regulator, partial [Planctomycetota bacterium]
EPLPDRDDLLDAILQASRHRVTILVADDEPLIRRMFSMYFKNEGYNVVAAQDGAEAKELVLEIRPDLVITDIQMPQADGYEVCRSVKQHLETKHIPVLIVSALGGDLDIDKGFHAGANEYVTKPVDLSELSARIRSIFRGIASRGRERVLIVTPSQIERSMLEYGLSQQGFEVVSASSGEEALALARTKVPSVIVSDLKIPGLELTDLRDRLNESRETKKLPLVVLSSAVTKLDRNLRQKLRAAAYITKPFPIERLVVQIERIVAQRRANLVLERKHLLETIVITIRVLEARDAYTSGHSEKVALYATMIARRLFGMEEEVQRIRLSAHLHDLGKVGIHDGILRKPGKLTDEEWAEMKQHPVIGADILRGVESLHDIIPGVRWHHERMDGKGYPDGLAGEDIPIMARIIAVADTFDALTSDRPYRKGFGVDKAMDIIREAAGPHLDANLVAVFEEIVAAPDFPRPDAALAASREATDG